MHEDLLIRTINANNHKKPQGLHILNTTDIPESFRFKSSMEI